MEGIRKFFRGLKKQLIVGFSRDYIYTNGIHGETRGLPDKCPHCPPDYRDPCGRGPMRWYGSCQLFGFIDTPLRCERFKCDACQSIWGRNYYYQNEVPIVRGSSSQTA